jgi:hypothetical protein
MLALAASGNRVYAGGRFTEIGGVTNRRLVAIAPPPAWSTTPTFGRRPDWTVRGVGVSPDRGKAYAVGGFTLIGGATRPAAAEVSAANGTATAFHPVVANGGVVLSMALTPDGSRLFFSTESNRIDAYAPAISSGTDGAQARGSMDERLRQTSTTLAQAMTTAPSNP